MVVFNWFSILFGKLEVNFISEKIFNEEIHNFGVFLVLKEIINEHICTSSNKQFSSILILMHSHNRSIARISQRSRCENGIWGESNIKSSSLNIDKICSFSFRSFLILFFLIISASHHKLVVSSFGLFCITIYNSSYFFVKDSALNISFFRVEVFVKRCSHHAVAVYADPEFGTNLADVGIVPLISTFVAQDHQFPTGLDVFDKIGDFLRSVVILWGGDDEQVGFPDFLEVDSIFIETDLNLAIVTLYSSLYFLANFLRLAPGFP